MDHRKLSKAEWLAARNELNALIQRAKLTDVPGLLPMLERTCKTLDTDTQPAICAIELEYAAALLRRHPQLRDAVIELSQRLYQFPITRDGVSDDRDRDH